MFPAPPELRRTAPVVAVLGVVAVLVLVVVLVVGSGSDEGDRAGSRSSGEPDTTTGSAGSAPPSPDAPSATLLSDVDTAALTVQRAGFCDLVAPASIEQALGGEPADVRTYGNGEKVVVSPDLTDIAHEFGCRWKRGRTVLRAWVFAPPVTTADAARLVAAARSTDGCDVRRGAPDYGSVSVARTCPVGDGFEASYRGLFKDAWLACSLTASGTQRTVLERAGAWCVSVAEAAAQPPA